MNKIILISLIFLGIALLGLGAFQFIGSSGPDMKKIVAEYQTECEKCTAHFDMELNTGLEGVLSAPSGRRKQFKFNWQPRDKEYVVSFHQDSMLSYWALGTYLEEQQQLMKIQGESLARLTSEMNSIFNTLTLNRYGDQLSSQLLKSFCIKSDYGMLGWAVWLFMMGTREDPYEIGDHGWATILAFRDATIGCDPALAIQNQVKRAFEEANDETKMQYAKKTAEPPFDNLSSLTEYMQRFFAINQSDIESVFDAVKQYEIRQIAYFKCMDSTGFTRRYEIKHQNRLEVNEGLVLDTVVVNSVRNGFTQRLIEEEENHTQITEIFKFLMAFLSEEYLERFADKLGKLRLKKVLAASEIMDLIQKIE